MYDYIKNMHSNFKYCINYLNLIKNFIFDKFKFFISIILKSIIVAILIYLFVDKNILDKITPLLGLVFIVVCLILLMILFQNSRVFILKYVFILFGLFVALIIYKCNGIANFFSQLLQYIVNYSLKDVISTCFEYYVLHLIFLVILVFICYIMNKKSFVNNVNYNNIKDLYPSRENALKNLEDAIEKCNVIGINGEFGSGKSILIENYRKAHSKDIYITISSVSMNVDNVEAYILKQLRQVLLNNRVYDSSIDAVIAYFEKWKFINIFNDGMFYCDLFKSIKESLKLIRNKKIVFIIDDLDRVVNKEIIIKVFNIFELLCDDNNKENSIKCFYLYDINNLISIMYKDEVKNVDENELILRFKKLIQKYVQYEVMLLLPCKEDFEVCKDVKIKVIEIINSINNFYAICRVHHCEYSNFDFSLYCKYNPRVFDRIEDNFNVLFKRGIINCYNETKYLEALIYKHFFHEVYDIYLKQKYPFHLFLADLDYQNTHSVLSDKYKEFNKYKYWLIYCIFEKNRLDVKVNSYQYQLEYNNIDKDIDDILRNVA